MDCQTYPEMLESLDGLDSKLADPKSARKEYPTPDYAKNTHRSIKPEIFVTVGICSHLGCSPVSKFVKGLALIWVMIGQEDFFAHVTAQLLILLEGSMLTSLRQTTLRFRGICT